MSLDNEEQGESNRSTMSGQKETSRRKYLAVAGLSGTVSLTGCLGMFGSSNNEDFIRYLGWGGNTQDAAKKVFEGWTEETGIEVRHQSAGGNAEFLSILKQNKGSIDLFNPSSNGIVNARKDDLLAEIDYSKIPNYTNNIKEEWRNVPYIGDDAVFRDALTIGLAYNSDELGEINSWDVLTRDNLKGQVSTWDIGYLRFGQAAHPAGHSMNDLPSSEEKFQDCVDILKQQHQNINTYWTSPSQSIQFLREGNALVSEIFGGRVLALQESGHEHIHYTVPEEGAIMGDENYCIPAASKKKDLAHELINYNFQRDKAKQLSLDLGYPIQLKNTPQEIKDLPDYVESPDQVTLRDWDKISPVQEEWSQRWTQLKQQWS